MQILQICILIMEGEKESKAKQNLKDLLLCKSFVLLNRSKNE